MYDAGMHVLPQRVSPEEQVVSAREKRRKLSVMAEAVARRVSVGMRRRMLWRVVGSRLCVVTVSVGFRGSYRRSRGR